METNLQGRLRNTPLPVSHALLPLFEAVVNAIHSVDEAHKTDPERRKISLEVVRAPQSPVLNDSADFKKIASLSPVQGFVVTDNGVGFTDQNLKSFETLDSDFKASIGCRGVGRLLWLKAFERAEISSAYANGNGELYLRTFSFNPASGTHNFTNDLKAPGDDALTSVRLEGFKKWYSDRAPRSAQKLAVSLLEHCLWYFVRPGGAPHIEIVDDTERLHLDDVYDTYMCRSASTETLKVRDQDFSLTHVKLKANSGKQHQIAWCAAGRLVKEESITGKVPGLHGRLQDGAEEFTYSCYVSSPYLDERVRSERFAFDINEVNDDLFADVDLSLREIRTAVLDSVAHHLSEHLEENRNAGRERVERFVTNRAPRYRPVLGRMQTETFDVDPTISDRDLDLLLHRQLADFEAVLLTDGHELMKVDDSETANDYEIRLSSYLDRANELKNSDLVNYVFHRKVILDLLQKAIQRGADGKYAREDVVHELIMPMRKTSNEVKTDSSNLWLIDERLAFHTYLASDKPLSSMPITASKSSKEPDICVLNVYDEPLLVAEGQSLPLASIVILEIKRPMRDDAAAGESKDPVEQALGYLKRIRDGGAMTPQGRLIPGSQSIPGFCYVLCDLTPSIKERCLMLTLRETSDFMGYFGFNPNYNAYIEVISFDRLLNGARERNRAFFDHLGLPAT